MKRLNDNLPPQNRLTTRKFINILETKLETEIKPMIDKAIAGDEPDAEDLSTLEYHLIEERPRYTTGRLDTSRFSNLSENEIGRFIIEENVIINEKPLWKIYEWIFLVWNLAIPVKRCAADDCSKIFTPAPQGSEQKYCSPQCRNRMWARKNR